jgi:hypothetical protein
LIAAISEGGRGMLPMGSVSIDMERSVAQQEVAAIHRKVDCLQIHQDDFSTLLITTIASGAA